MKIGIIGAGLIGQILANKFNVSGHEIILADRKGANAIKAVADAVGVKAVELEEVVLDIDVLIVSIPLINIPDLVQTLKGQIEDKTIIVETTNYWPHRDGNVDAIDNGMVNSVWVQQQFGRPVVKAFSNIGAYSMAAEGKPSGTADRIALAVSGDVQQAIDVVMGIVDEAGFDPLDAGKLEDSWRQQACGPAYCTDLTLAELINARKTTKKDELREKQELAFSKMKELGDEYFDNIVSGNYPDGFVDHAVDINRAINQLKPRKISSKI
ncbi:NADPH-dependent F420 reductase [Fluviicola sp.]|uniref:NADPH-dependent F420 reductase n=1 Tax=Fluviicola sp. TaxID=1917219 RepID=UPI003D2C7E4B